MRSNMIVSLPAVALAGLAGGCATIIAKRSQTITVKPGTLSAALTWLKVSQNHGERTLTVTLVEALPAEFWDQLVPLVSN